MQLLWKTEYKSTENHGASHIVLMEHPISIVLLREYYGELYSLSKLSAQRQISANFDVLRPQRSLKIRPIPVVCFGLFHAQEKSDT
jgi:hypothetical protein